MFQKFFVTKIQNPGFQFDQGTYPRLSQSTAPPPPPTWILLLQPPILNLLIFPSSFSPSSSSSHPAYLAASGAATIHEFLLAHHPFAGSASAEQYFLDNNPMEWVEKVARPTLIVNSEDDMVCLQENIREDIVG